ncbi:MAG: hypothetical protein U0841_25355 [Chloroflexia bacterium]
MRARRPGGAEGADALGDRVERVAAGVPVDDARELLPGVLRAMDEVWFGREPGIDAGGATRDGVTARVGGAGGELLAHFLGGEAGGADQPAVASGRQ